MQDGWVATDGMNRIVSFRSQDSFEDEEIDIGVTKIADVAHGYIYFIDNREVVFKKSIEELGINVNASDPNSAFGSTRLRPILETLIRKNIPPQEAEMEEEEVEKKEQSAVIPLRFIPVFLGDDRTTNKSRNGA
jgi:hypothetical protein